MYQSTNLSQFFDHIKATLAESVYQRDNSFDLVKYLVLMSMLVVFQVLSLVDGYPKIHESPLF